jgi:hypothetical protein
LFVTAQERPIFNPEDAKVMFQNCLGVRPPEQTDFAKVAQDLDFIVLNFSVHSGGTAAPAEDRGLWIVGARQLLAAFGVNGPRNHLTIKKQPTGLQLAIPAITFPGGISIFAIIGNQRS